MGCGDGTFLEHLFSVVKTRTARGQVLDKHPLILVGADFNKVARRVAKQTLRKANCPTFHVIQGDINRPPQLAADLDDLGLDIHDLLHVRSFLDHNRPYSPPMDYVKGSRKGNLPARSPDWVRRLRPMNWRRTWSGTCAVGRPMSDVLDFYCWSCTRFPRSWLPPIWKELPQSLTTGRMDFPTNTWLSYRYSWNVRGRQGCARTRFMRANSHSPNWRPLV